MRGSATSSARQRAGALLPEGPIVVSGEPAGDGSPAADEPAETDAETDAADGTSTGSTGNQPAVVAPAPAETIGSDPEPAPEPGGPPATNPGNSANAPGQTGVPGNSGDAPGQNKP